MRLSAHLVPLKTGNYYEQIIVSVVTPQGTLYPSALVHIDTFWEGRDGKNEIYNKLDAGDVVDVEVEIK